MPKSDSKHGKDELLRILDAHGKQFLGSFGTSQIGSKRKDSPGLGGGQKKRLKKHIQEGSSSSSESEPEWNGFSHSLLTHGEGSTTPGEHSHSGGEYLPIFSVP